MGQRGTNGENLRGNVDKVTPMLKGKGFFFVGVFHIKQMVTSHQ